MSLTVALADAPKASPACRSARLFDHGKGPTVWVVDRDSGAVRAGAGRARRL